MNAALRGIACLALAAFAGAAHAIDDHLLFAQDTTGVVSATLAGIIDPCKGSRYFPMGVPSVAVVGREYYITSMFAIIDPPPCPDVGSHYESTASLGAVADGHYTVVWTLGGLIVTGAFNVKAGVLLATSPIPTLSVTALTGLASLIALAAFIGLRRRRAGSG
jgi:hypothetical protein